MQAASHKDTAGQAEGGFGRPRRAAAKWVPVRPKNQTGDGERVPKKQSGRACLFWGSVRGDQLAASLPETWFGFLLA